jgi:hypothetical protein
MKYAALLIVLIALAVAWFALPPHPATTPRAASSPVSATADAPTIAKSVPAITPLPTASDESVSTPPDTDSKSDAHVSDCYACPKDMRPFVGSLSGYPRYQQTDIVAVGHWRYGVIRMGQMMAQRHVRHSEYGPLGSQEDTSLVLGIELAVRNDSDAPSHIPSIQLINGETMGTDKGPVQQLIEFDQYDGYIQKALDSSVTVDPGEELHGVIAFDCCQHGLSPDAVLRVSSGVRSGKYAYIMIGRPSSNAIAQAKALVDKGQQACVAMNLPYHCSDPCTQHSLDILNGSGFDGMNEACATIKAADALK